jgi:hypothetical protein
MRKTYVALAFISLSCGIIYILRWLINHDFNYSLPKTIVEIQLPEAIAVDGTYIYWSTRGSDDLVNGQIMRAYKDGSNIETLASGLYTAWDIAVDDINVYWVSIDGVKKISKSGGSIDTLDIIPYDNHYGTHGSISGDIEVDNENVYWINYGPIKIYEKESKTVKEVDLGNIYWDIELHGNYIYGLTEEDNQAFLWRIYKDGTGLIHKYLQDGNIDSFTVDNTNVYWGVHLCFSDNSSNVMTMSFDGDTSSVVSSHWDCNSGPVDLTSDSDYLYWNTNFGTFSKNLMGIPKNGKRPHILAPNIFVRDIAIDDTGVYVTSQDNKIIFIAKH